MVYEEIRNPLIDEQIEKAKKIVSDFYTEAYSERKQYEDKWLKYYKAYCTYEVVTGTYKDRQLLPLAFSFIMAIVPKLIKNKQKIQYIIRRIPMLKDLDPNLIMTENITRESMSESCNHVTSYQMDIGNFDYRMFEFEMMKKIYGTGIIHACWSPNDKVFQNKINFDTVDPWEFFPDPNCTDAFSMNRCLRERYLDVFTVRRLIEQGVYAVPLPRDVQENLKSLEVDNTTQSYKKTAVGLTAQAKGINVKEYYEDDRIITVLSDKYVVRDSRNPLDYKAIPFFFAPNYIEPKSFWGKSEIELILEEIKHQTLLMDIIESNFELNINNKWLVDPDSDYSLEDLVNAPNMVIRGKPGSIQPLSIPDMTPTAFNMMRQSGVRMQETLGINDYSYPRMPERQELATTVNTLTESTNYRFSYSLDMTAMSMLKPLGRYVLELNKAYLEPFSFTHRTSEYGGQEIEEISETMVAYIKNIDRDYDVIAVSGDPKITEKQELNQLFNAALSNPNVAQMFMQNYDMVRLFDRLLNSYNIPTFDLKKQQVPPEITQPVENDPLVRVQQLAEQGDPEAQEILAQYQAQQGGGLTDETTPVQSQSIGAEA